MLNQDINLQQEQNLIMTPKLQQAIELLQLSTLELTEYLEKEVMENPLLELEDNYRYQSSTNYEEFDYKEFIAKEISLEEHLLKQLKLVVNNKSEEEIGRYIIGNLDGSGFFSLDEEIICKLNNSLKGEKFYKVLDMIKGFTPRGIASSGIKESLQIQLDSLKGLKEQRQVKLAKKVVENYLEEVGKNQVKKIARALRVKTREAQSIIDFIKSLNPIPSDMFTKSNSNSYLEPDIIIKKHSNDYTIIMDERSFPTLRINNYYKNLLKNSNQSDVNEYIDDRLNSALWLIKSIEQRRQTVYNIVEAFINLQQEFLDNGPKYLKPMTMKAIADQIGVHESTVSRATNDKYIQTPYGLFPFKYLFSESIDCKFTNVSAVSVKEDIKEIISKESIISPLSDEKIKAELEEKGIIISRRTIAKYRQELKIPSSRLRKRYE